MPEQHALPLSVDRPLARNSDSETSHTSARRLRDSGQLGEQLRHALELVAARQGVTTADLADGDAGLRHTLSRRLPDLETQGLVRKGAPIPSLDTKRPGATWFLTDKGEAVLTRSAA